MNLIWLFNIGKSILQRMIQTFLMLRFSWNLWKFHNCVTSFFCKEDVRYLVWTCRNPISLILRTRFSPVLGTR